MNWSGLSYKVLEGEPVTKDEALAVLQAGDDQLLSLLDAAFRVRLHYHGREVRLHVLQNAKSGMCRENCAFCSQAIGAYSGVDRYHMQTIEELVAGAREAHDRQAVKYCMVTATRGPSATELDVICEAVRQIKQDVPIEICTSLGLLNDEQARRLAEAGVHRFNHNLETSRRYFPHICQTHTYDDRVATVRAAKAAGMEACCGGIVGMGEELDDRVELAFALSELNVESIPVNFLDPRPGTPLADVERLSPADCLKALAMFRFVNPQSEIRVAGGREVNLRHLQPLALYPANSMFTEGYLTTPGQGYERDLAMIRDAGFTVAELTPA
jgi:biotin synthase